MCYLSETAVFFFCDASATCMKQLQNLYCAFSGDEIFKLRVVDIVCRAEFM